MDTTTKEKVEAHIKNNSIALFIKGTKDFPQCGFSNQVVQIFKVLGSEFETMDILADENVRAGMKEYSQWPTFPQTYINGEFVGGCDIVTEMYQSGELENMLKAVKAS